MNIDRKKSVGILSQSTGWQSKSDYRHGAIGVYRGNCWRCVTGNSM